MSTQAHRKAGIRQLRLAGVAALLMLLVAALTAAPAGAATAPTITNFDAHGHQVVRFDTAGNAVDAHDGGIIRAGDAYYLYGTSYNCGFTLLQTGTPWCGIAVYRSTDLVHWSPAGLGGSRFAFNARTSQWQQRCAPPTFGCFRPHVVYDAHTRRFVMWINTPSTDAGYTVLTSARPGGPFTEVPQPPKLAVRLAGFGGLVYGDESLFVDHGTAYLAYTVIGPPNNLHDIAIERLDRTYTTGTGAATRLGLSLVEAPSLFEHNGTYYATFSDPACPYCTGTGTGYKTAPTPLGPWSAATTVASANSCGGQPSFVATLPERGGGTIYLYGSDLWDGRFNEGLANYFWAPLKFGPDGAIEQIQCSPTSTVNLAGSSPGHQAPVPGLDQTSGVDGFTTSCDIAGSTEHMQTFTAGRTGTLRQVRLTAFQESSSPTGGAAANAPLRLQLVTLTPQGGIGQVLAQQDFGPAAVGWSARNLVMTPNMQVSKGATYAVVASSATSQGCYGVAANDSSPYPGGYAATSTDSGQTFTPDPARDLKFLTVVSG